MRHHLGATAGSLFVWASIFAIPARGVLNGIGFALYALALIRPLRELVENVRDVMLVQNSDNISGNAIANEVLEEYHTQGLQAIL